MSLIRYPIMFTVNLIISFPLVTIPWFTWWAWVGVALILTYYYWFQITHEENAEESTKRECRRLDTISDKLDELIELTRRNVSNSDTEREKILAEVKKIGRTVRHEVNNL